jgi:GT2 family glycosyltransferase
MTALRGWRLPRALPGALADCSLVVPTYQRPEDLTTLLEALAALADPPAEMVIVDGTPGTHVEAAITAWARGRQLRFDLVYASSPKGLTRQRNVGIDLSSHPYVFFLDDDAVPLAGYFTGIRRVFAEDREHRVGAVGGAIVNQINRAIPRRWRLRLALGLVPRVEPGTYHHSGTSTPRGLQKPFTGTKPVDVLPGCAFAFRREVLEQERFSEFFDGYSQGEDLEMSLRVGRRWKVISSGDARVIHKPAAGGRPGSFAKGRMEVRNRFFIWKRYSSNAPLVDRARFWSDLLFLFVMDAVWFCARPWRLRVLAHGFGILCAAAECLVSPPRYEQPPARRTYELNAARESVLL